MGFCAPSLAKPSMTDRPFGCPPDVIEITLDLPFPPSTNHIWRRTKTRVYRSAKYLRWMNNADALVLSNRQYPRHKIVGPFAAELLFSENAGHGDLDNRIKCTLDWLVSRDVITDDVHCRDLRARWVEHPQAPLGARVMLRGVA